MLRQSGQFSEDMIPTVGFNMRKITKGNVTIKGKYVQFTSVAFIERDILILMNNFLLQFGILVVNHDSDQCGSVIAAVLTR